MAYADINFRSKKALKAAVADGEQVTCYQPGLGPDLSSYSGTAYLEGPHFPATHTWWAQVTLVDGVVVKVK